LLQLDSSKSFEENINSLSEEFLEDNAISKLDILNSFNLFLDNMSLLDTSSKASVDSITIIGGNDKNGNSEDVHLTLKKGEIICIVGPTGSGKSRLLEDIECLAQCDTPTNRQILINDEAPTEEIRGSI